MKEESSFHPAHGEMVSLCVTERLCKRRGLRGPPFLCFASVKLALVSMLAFVQTLTDNVTSLVPKSLL